MYKETQLNIIMKLKKNKKEIEEYNKIKKEEYNKYIEELYNNYKALFLYNTRNIGLKEEELLSDFYLLLLKAIEQFDVSKNVKFSVYLTSKIKFYVKNMFKFNTNHLLLDEKIEELKLQHKNIKDENLRNEKNNQIKQLEYSKKYNNNYMYKQINDDDKESLFDSNIDKINNKLDVDIFLNFAKEVNKKTYEIFIDYYYNNLTLNEISKKHNNCSNEAIRLKMEEMIKLYNNKIKRTNI